MSLISVDGQPFHDPEADRALRDGLHESLGPTVAGVCGTDPFRLMPVFLRQLKEIGFSGVQNFPTVGLIDGVSAATSKRPAWVSGWK